MKRFVALALAAAPQALFAQFLTAMTVSPGRVAVNESITLSVHVKANGLLWCGLKVTYGDGEVKEIRVEKSPLMLSKKYSSAGSYVIEADGTGLFLGLGSAVPCLGSVESVRVVVTDPAADARERERAANEEARRKAQEAELERLRQEAARPPAKEEQVNPTKSPSKAVVSPRVGPTGTRPPLKRPSDESMDIFKN